MRRRKSLGVLAAAVLIAGAIAIARTALQGPAIRPADENTLREYAGVYQWGPDAFVYLQLWNELTGTNQLTAFDEAGDVRVLFPTDRDRFFAGPGAAVSTSVESGIAFQRDPAGRIVAMTWHWRDAPPRTARRVEIERREDVRFRNGDVQLAGTLIAANTRARHPALILVHGSGPGTREVMLPFARFLVRRGVAVLGYDKRGVGGSTGDWNTSSFEDLAGDAVAAFEYLKTRSDIDPQRIGLMGVSQAGWIMPIAAVRARGIAFLISVSGAGVSAAETTVDHAQHEMNGRGMKPQTVDQILAVMKLQNRYAATGQGWDEYAAARAALAARLGQPPGNFPATPEDPYWRSVRPMYAYDPQPTLRQLLTPTLALFGERDNNILPDKNHAAWDAALRAAGNRDYTLRIVPRANHIHLEATLGTNAEMPTLQRFAPAYASTIIEWLAARLPGFAAR